MNWQGDRGLELFVASKRYGDRQQYIDSISAMLAVNAYELRDRIKIISLDSLKGERLFFETIAENPGAKVRLPFLVSAHGCETGVILGYSGLEEVLEVLGGPSFVSTGR